MTLEQLLSPICRARQRLVGLSSLGSQVRIFGITLAKPLPDVAPPVQERARERSPASLVPVSTLLRQYLTVLLIAAAFSANAEPSSIDGAPVKVSVRPSRNSQHEPAGLCVAKEQGLHQTRAFDVGMQRLHEPDSSRSDQAASPAIGDASLLWKLAGISGLLILGVLLLNRTLRREVRRRRAAEKTLAQSEKRYREMVETTGSSDFHFFSLDHEGRFLCASPSSLEWFGIDAENMIGLHWQEIAPWTEGTIDRTEATLATCLAGEVPPPVVMEHGSDQRRQQLVSYPRPVRDDDGRTLRIEGITVNHTLRLRLEEHLLASIQAAQEAGQAKSDFLATMSHELRTPLNAIMGMIHLCLETPVTEQQRGYLESAHRASSLLLSLMSDVLDVSKAEAGRITLESSPFALDELLETLVTVFRTKKTHSDLRLSLDVAPEVPCRLEGDRLRLAQILTNLVDNAVKFTDAGEIGVEVRVLDERGEHIHLEWSVIDSGIGIAPDQLPVLFQPFRQADASITRRFGGTGLGLSIAKRLVELMDGSIDVESRLGEGSTFRFDVWLRRAPTTSEGCQDELPAGLGQTVGADSQGQPLRPEGEPPPEAGIEQVRDLLEHLRCLVSERNPTAEDFLVEQHAALARGLSAECHRALTERIGHYQFDEAAAALCRLLERPGCSDASS